MPCPLLLLLLFPQGHLHRDVKLSNVLMDSSSGVIRIADPGCMAPIGNDSTCCSNDAPHLDICRLPFADKAAVSALHTPALDIRQAALSALTGFIGGKNMPYGINMHDNPHDGWKAGARPLDGRRARVDGHRDAGQTCADHIPHSSWQL